MAWFSWTNHNSLLCIATNQITSFCIDNRLRQMAFFSCSPKWTKAWQRPYVEIFWNEKKSFIPSSLFWYYIKQIDSILPCVCSVIHHRRRQEHQWHTRLSPSVPLDVIRDLLLNRRTIALNLFFKSTTKRVITVALCKLRIGSCLVCVYRVMDARGKFGEHESSVRVVRGAAESNSSFLSALQTSQVHS